MPLKHIVPQKVHPPSPHLSSPPPPPPLPLRLIAVRNWRELIKMYSLLDSHSEHMFHFCCQIVRRIVLENLLEFEFAIESQSCMRSVSVPSTRKVTNGGGIYAAAAAR